MEKRDFLKKLSLLTAGGFAGGMLSSVNAHAVVNNSFVTNKKIGLQIYSLGRELTDDVPNGLKKIKEIGYSTIELASYSDRKIGNYSISDYLKLAGDAGIEITGSHVNPSIRQYTRENMQNLTDFWKIAVEDHVKIGVKTVVQPSMPQIENHNDAAIACEVFNKAGEIAKSAGLKWGYHNHNMEFQRIAKEDAASGQNRRMTSGDLIYDLLLDGTDPKLVFFEMDVYWTVMGQADPLEYFEKHAGRFPILHIKDRSVLGQSGMMNFQNIFTKAYGNGLDEFYVELEGIRSGNMTQFEGVKLSFDYLNEASFVR
jgi:sugar phosphate isomerase/epimerase